MLNKPGAQTLWRNRDFIKVYAAFCASTCGDWLDSIAVMLLFGYTWSASPTLLAFIPLAYALPGILLGQAAGILADKPYKLPVLVGSDLLQAVLSLLMLLQTGPVSILLLLSLRSAAGVFKGPAQQALTRQLVDKDQLLKAASVNGFVVQSAKVVGPALGAGLAAATSPYICIGINAISFVLSALILLSLGRIKASGSVPRQRSTSPESTGINGWRVLLDNRVLLISTVFSLLSLAAILLVDAQFVVVLREFAPGSPQLAGWLVSIIGCGALCAVLLLQRFKEINNYALLQGSSSLLMGAMFAALAMLKPGQPYLWPLICGLLGGFGTGLANVGYNYILQKETPQHALGQIYGIYTALSSGVFVIAPLVGARLISTWGVKISLLSIGFALVILGLSGIGLRRSGGLCSQNVIDESKSSIADTGN